MRVHLLSTAVAPLGSGLGGGVETMVVNAAQQLQTFGHRVQILAPMDSVAANRPGVPSGWLSSVRPRPPVSV